MYEPGLDREYWETEWAEFEADLQDSPMESLSEVDDLIARMLVAAGYPIDTQDPVDEEGIDPEIHRAFLAAREVTWQADNGTDVDPGDVAQAINDYRALYEHLLAREIDTST
jgi:hypothetical protein